MIVVVAISDIGWGPGGGVGGPGGGLGGPGGAFYFVLADVMVRHYFYNSLQKRLRFFQVVEHVCWEVWGTCLGGFVGDVEMCLDSFREGC